MDNKFVDFNQLKFNQLIAKKGELREFDDRFELCLIKEYEDKYTDFIIDSIPIGDVFVQLLQYKNTTIVVSYEFFKNQFDVQSIINWLEQYNVMYIPKNDQNKIFIQNADSILSALKFRGNILLYHHPQYTSII